MESSTLDNNAFAPFSAFSFRSTRLLYAIVAATNTRNPSSQRLTLMDCVTQDCLKLELLYDVIVSFLVFLVIVPTALDNRSNEDDYYR